MAKRAPLSADEAADLFSHLNESGTIDPTMEQSERMDRERERQAHVDPLSNQDPSGSRADDTISKAAMVCIILVLVVIVGAQLGYGLVRRLNTANLSLSVDVETVEQALESGVEWGNGFTQFPSEFTVDEASEKTGVIEVSVVDTESETELELLSNSQIQAAALATNALLNDKIDRVIYNVYVLVDEDGAMQHDSFFGLVSATGTRKAMLTFMWTKSESENSSSIDWELVIIGMDEATTAAIQEQVNSVSSIANDATATESELAAEQNELLLGKAERTGEVFIGPSADEDEDDDASLAEELSDALSSADSQDDSTAETDSATDAEPAEEDAEEDDG